MLFILLVVSRKQGHLELVANIHAHRWRLVKVYSVALAFYPRSIIEHIIYIARQAQLLANLLRHAKMTVGNDDWLRNVYGFVVF